MANKLREEQRKRTFSGLNVKFASFWDRIVRYRKTYIQSCRYLIGSLTNSLLLYLHVHISN